MRLALLLVLVIDACGGGERPREGESARGLRGGEWPETKPAIAVAEAVAPAEAVPAFVFEPSELMVYRSTSVHFKATPPASRTSASCEWSWGDGSPPTTGCIVSHTFDNGNADARVTLTLKDGDWAHQSIRVVPLERLPVSRGGPRSTTDDNALPAAPKASPTSYRAVLLADLGTDLSTLAHRITELRPDLVVVVGGASTPSEPAPWDLVRNQLAEPLRAAGIPILWGVSPADLSSGAEVRRPIAGTKGDPLELASGDAFPERWSLAFKGTYLTFVSGSALTDAALDWLRARLAEAQIYESRIVVSYLPLHPFNDQGPAAGLTLGPKFKVYELLLRARATAFVSAGHRAYFKGRYGALPVVSVGAASGPGAKLAGHDFEQPASLVIMDVEGGVPKRIFALEAPGYDQVLDEGYLPETVEVYTR